MNNNLSGLSGRAYQILLAETIKIVGIQNYAKLIKNMERLSKIKDRILRQEASRG